MECWGRRTFQILSMICALTAAGAAALHTGPAEAAGAGKCQAYTAAAIKAAADVRAMNCGYDLNNPQWSTDPKVHLRWCTFANDDSVNNESNDRISRVGACTMCRNYATTAIKQVNLNIKMSCGGTGPQWTTNPDDHFNWCMGLKDYTYSGFGMAWIAGTYIDVQGELNDENAARDSVLGQCFRLQRGSQPLTVSPAQKPNFNSSTSSKVGKPALNIPKPSNSTKRGEGSDSDFVPKGGNTGGAALVKGPTRNTGSSSKVLGPGLLESDSPFSPQGPAAAGTPVNSGSTNSSSNPFRGQVQRDK